MSCLTIWFGAIIPLLVALQSAPSSTDPFTMASWRMYRGTSDGRPAVTRGNAALRDLKDKKKYPYRVGFVVPLLKPDRNGFPYEEEATQLSAIENKIDHLLSSRKIAFLSLVITTGGMREFVFYSNQPDAARKVIQSVGQKMMMHQIQSYVLSDPSWEVYYRFTQ